jgi:hypothetical protein
MTTLVSSSTLPATLIDPFAALLDRLRHGVKIASIHGPGQAEQILAPHGSQSGKPPGEIQDLALPCVIESIHLLHDLLFNSLAHF